MVPRTLDDIAIHASKGVANFCVNDWALLLELLNKVCDLGLLEILLVGMNCCLRFGFGGSTVLVVSRGDQMSCYTTEGALVAENKDEFCICSAGYVPTAWFLSCSARYSASLVSNSAPVKK